MGLNIKTSFFPQTPEPFLWDQDQSILTCGGKKGIQFKGWRDFGGNETSPPSVLRGGESNKKGYECLELSVETDF